LRGGERSAGFRTNEKSFGVKKKNGVDIGPGSESQSMIARKKKTKRGDGRGLGRNPDPVSCEMTTRGPPDQHGGRRGCRRLGW